jgi:hypothetical protein
MTACSGGLEDYQEVVGSKHNSAFADLQGGNYATKNFGPVVKSVKE